MVSGYLLDAAGWRRFEDIIQRSIIWPSGAGRLPTNVSCDIILCIASKTHRFTGAREKPHFTESGSAPPLGRDPANGALDDMAR